MAIVCPITSHVEGYPFEVPLPAGGAITGVVLSDQIKCVDWRARRAKPSGRAVATVEETLIRIKLILGI